MSILKSRRAFLETTGFAAAAVMGSPWGAWADDIQPPDLIVINAKVTTMDPAKPMAVLNAMWLESRNDRDLK